MLRNMGFAVAAIASAGTAWADDQPKYGAVPDWVKPAPPIDMKAADPQTQFLIFDQQQRIEDGALWAFIDTAVPISTPAALSEAATIQLPWMPDHGDLVIHRAQILRGAETIDLLAGGAKFQVLQRELGMEQRMLTGMLTATLEPSGLRLGDVLRVTFSATAKDPALRGDVQTVLPLLAKPLRAQFARARLTWPKALTLTIRDYVDGVEPVTKTVGDWNEIEIALPIEKLPEIPQDAPVRFQPLPIVEAASFADWRSVSRTMAPLYATPDTLIAPGSPLSAEVARIAKAGKTKRERAALALQAVQGQVRYLFRGMEGGNYTPQAPAQTWELRYGDCKAKTLLLLAMLRKMDIDAEAVLVNSVLGDRLPQRLPSAGAFDHVIVHATVDGSALWLDGTSAGARIEDLADVPPFRHALPLRVEGSGLIPIPLLPPARPDIEVTLKLDQRAGADFPVPFSIEVALRGALAGQLEEFARRATDDQVEGFVSSTIDDFVSVTTVYDEKVRYDAATGRAVVSAAGITYPRWQRVGAESRLALDYLVPGLNITADRSRAAWRTIPVATGNAGLIVVTTTTQLPGSLRLDGPTQFSTTIGDMTIDRQAALGQGVLTLVERQTSGGAEIAPGDLGKVRQQAAQAKARLVHAAVPVGAPRWEKVKSAGKAAFAPILDGFDRAIVDAPESSAPLFNRSLFRESIYDWQGAIDDLTKAIAIQEQVVYLKNRAGLYRAVSNDDAALADLIAAQALEPDDFESASALATLYADRGDNDAALAIIGDRADAQSDTGRGYLALKASVLARTGEPKQAIAAIDGAIGASPRDANLLNQRCWLRGTLNVELDAALADCTRALEIGDASSAALDSRALLHLRNNRLDAAERDLDAALDLAPEQSASLYLRGIVRQAQGNAAGARTDLAAARLLAPRIDEEYARWGVKP